MIPSTKSAWFAAWFARDTEKRIRRSFSSVRIRGLDALRRAAEQGPVLVVSNHTAWWDPLVAILLSHRILNTDGFALMDAKNLRRLPFFGRVGAFGVDLDDQRDGARAMRYAAKLLTAKEPTRRRLVWIFAQGREMPITTRPLAFRRGAAEISKLAKAAPSLSVVPIALRYEMGSKADPALWIACGTPMRGGEPDTNAEHARQENAVTEELDRIDRAITELCVGGAETEGFETLFEKHESPIFELLQRMLGWITKPRSPRGKALGDRRQASS